MLTDLEICKRIAEIDMVHYEVDAYTGKVFVRDLDGNITINGRQYEVFNPLTDDALCFQLVVKYEVNICFLGEVHAECYGNSGYSLYSHSNKNPNKAICLAIIEANSNV